MSMFSMRSGGTLRKRAAVWTMGILILLAWYVLAAPIVVYPVERWLPGAMPFLEVVYGPLVYLSDNPDVPGHDAFRAYVDWCYDSLSDKF